MHVIPCLAGRSREAKSAVRFCLSALSICKAVQAQCHLVMTSLLSVLLEVVAGSAEFILCPGVCLVVQWPP